MPTNSNSAHRLFYERPAAAWTEALPLGNARLGAMVFGGITEEYYQLNEETLWTGGPYTQFNPDARANIGHVRDLVFSGRETEAIDHANQHCMGRPVLQMAYQPAGDLRLLFDLPSGTTTKYVRALYLDEAVATVTHRTGGVCFTRESLISAPAGVLAIRISADRPRAVSFICSLDSQQPGDTQLGELGPIFIGQNLPDQGIAAALKFQIGTRILPEGGEVIAEGNAMRVKGADSALILVDIATSFRNFDDTEGDPSAIEARLERAAAAGWDVLKGQHITEYRRYYDRFQISLPTDGSSDRPTDERIASYAESGDPSLAALFLNFGRYLMISSSRPGTQAATLQGLWNDQMRPPWGSKYTCNINLQMNYWLPDLVGLSDCFGPFLDLLEDVAITGRKTARDHYGARGWVLHHNTDIWRATGPTDGARWGLWPTGGLWLCVQAWDHAVFAGRPKVLLERLIPIMAGAIRFALDVLQRDPLTGHLVICPSLSPENVHPRGTTLSAGVAMDTQLLRALFAAYEEALATAGRTDPMLAEIRAARAELPDHRIGQSGQLQEWLQDWDDGAADPHHRHVSHLWALYPDHQITCETTPDLAEAAGRTLAIRGNNATGWGLAWRLCLFARLRDDASCSDALNRLLSPDRCYPNMFSAHPPFQIDGNFGGSAGVVEMIVQSRPDGNVFLLPALPSGWEDGEIRGVGLRGGISMDMAWQHGRVMSARFRSSQKQKLTVHLHGRKVTCMVGPDETGNVISALSADHAAGMTTVSRIEEV